MEKNSQRINFSTGVKYKGRYYLTAMHMNALFMYDEQNDKLTFLTNFQKEEKKEALYLKSFLYKEEAWFIPCWADQIAIVNLEKLSVEYMPLLYHKEYHDTYVKYVNILPFKDHYLCLIPQDVDAVMIVDLKNKRVKAYYGIVEADKNYHGAVFHDEKIYFFPWKEENILILNLKTDERIYRPWKEEREAFGDAVYDESFGQLFHVPARENYIRVDSLHGEAPKKVKFGDWNDREYKTYYATESEREFFFWGNKRDIVLKIDKENCSVKQYQLSCGLSENCYFPICSDSVEALVFDGNCIIRYDSEKDIFNFIYIDITYEIILHEIEMSGINIKNIMGDMENSFWRLQQFMLCIQMKKDIESVFEKKCVGESIYKYACEK